MNFPATVNRVMIQIVESGGLGVFIATGVLKKNTDMNRFRHILLLGVLVFSSALTAQQARTIKGTVTDGTNPMEDVLIEVQGTETRIFSDAEGKYSVDAEVGDMLKYSYAGMKDYLVRVEDVTRYLNLIMIPHRHRRHSRLVRPSPV